MKLPDIFYFVHKNDIFHRYNFIVFLIRTSSYHWQEAVLYILCILRKGMVLMHPLLGSVLYIALLGILSQAVGSLLPRRLFHADRFPFHTFSWENEGRIYQRLKIRRWKDRVPDMSRIMKNMVRKKLPVGSPSSHMDLLVQETCVAELIHEILIVLGLFLLHIWPGIGGWLVYLLYVLLGNLPFIIIQRYNRPRLIRLAAKTRRHEDSQ